MLDGCERIVSLKTQLNTNDEISATSIEMSVVPFTALTLHLLGTTTSQQDFLLWQPVTIYSVNTHNCKMWCYQSFVSQDSDILGYDAVSLSDRFPRFQRHIPLSKHQETLTQRYSYFTRPELLQPTQAYIRWIKEALPAATNGRRVRRTIHLHLALRLRTSGAKPPTPLGLNSVYGDRFTFYL